MKKLLLFILLPFALYSCSKNDDGTNEIDNPLGKPYKVRLEISTDKPDVFNVYLMNCVYNIYKNGTTNPVSITGMDDYLTSYPSPMKKEFDLPQEFDGLGFGCGTDEDFEGSEIAKVYLKFYVNDKLLFSYEHDKRVTIFFYKSGNKYLVDINYNVAVFEFDKLD